MERGSLRPVPLRPHGPVDAAEAERHVATALPALAEPAARALALVEIAGRARGDVASAVGLSVAELREALYVARKELRRSIFPLAATGWCERAERLISEELDGLLEGGGAARLAAHRRHCDRCVEHDRRLAQARDGLVRSFVEAHPPAPAPVVAAADPEIAEPAPPPPPAELRIVPPPEAALPAPPVAPAADARPEAMPAAPDPAPAVTPPAPAVTAPAPAAAPPVRSAASYTGFAWTALYATSILLAVLSVVLTVLAATGTVERVF